MATINYKDSKPYELNTNIFYDKGVPCNEDEIFFYVWGDEIDRTITNSSIRTLVKNLRKKIPKDLIKNQYGVGYKIEF